MATTAVRAVDTFGEHVSVMKALYQEYQKKDDIDAVAQLGAVLAEAQILCNERQSSVREAIKGLSQEVATREAQSQYPNVPGSHERRVAALEADIRDIKQAIEQLHGSSREVEAQRQALRDRMVQLNVRARELESSVTTEEPVLRHQLSLFAHISKVTWRLDIEDRIVGTVSDAVRGDLRTVDIDPSSTTHFDAVNRLWALI